MAPIITRAIVELYHNAGMKQPTKEQRVVLLNELLGGYNLTCAEIAGLTSEAASSFLLRHGAILEPVQNANRERLAGYIYVNATSGHIFVERDDLFVRRRFSVAHELGHYVLHFYPLIAGITRKDQYEQIEITESLAPFLSEDDTDELPVGRGVQTDLSIQLPPYEQMENEANQFAAELLMPVENVQYLLARYAPDCRGDDLIWRLATEMMVSRAAMRWRLRELHLLPLTTAQWN
ncbi:MAG TPA: ImmA/IrrE family metallo-endopeptidase [Ktedonobacteraceae bacterium]|nr:ImmA/IrrE family metallo-endopeptidase [Ktedonobacteraceae bacterium]